MAAEFPGAIWTPNTHFWTGRNGHKPQWIILHGTAGFETAQEVAAFFQTNNPQTSSHYIVGMDGTVIQTVREEDSAWANGGVSAGHDAWWSPDLNPNYTTISIEHVKPHSDNSDVLTPAQAAASAKLVDYLCKKWGIPGRAADSNGGVTGHFSMDPVDRSFCPGVYPWENLWLSLTGETSTMGLPPDSLILADAVHFKEFYGGYHGTCGETALTAALVCALKLGDTHDQAVALMLEVTAQMRAKGWADASGASTLWSLAREAVTNQGATINTEWDYAEPFPHDWHSVLLANAAIRPIVLQVGRAYNLIGQDGTGNAEAGVHYHFICVVGKCKDGYIVMDGDNWEIEQEFSIYSYDTLNNADICGLLMLDITPKGSPMAVPADWKDDGTTLTAPNGKTVVRGFRSHIIDHNPQWPTALVPVDEEADGGTGVEQSFALLLEWDSKTDVISELYGSLAPAPVPADPTLQAELAAANAKIATLQGQIAALHSATAGVTQVLSPLASAEAALEAAMKAAGL